MYVYVDTVHYKIYFKTIKRTHKKNPSSLRDIIYSTALLFVCIGLWKLKNQRTNLKIRNNVNQVRYYFWLVKACFILFRYCEIVRKYNIVVYKTFISNTATVIATVNMITYHYFFDYWSTIPHDVYSCGFHVL